MKATKLIFAVLFISSLIFLSLTTYINISISNKGTFTLAIDNETIEVYYSKPRLYNEDVIALGFHGFMEYPTMFYPIANVLAQQGIIFYSLSMPGFGRTSLKLFADLKESTNWEVLLEENILESLSVLNKSIDKLKSITGAKRVILFGSGMGGGIVLHINLIRNDVAASVIWNPSGFNETLIEKLKGKIKNFLYILGEFDDQRYKRDAIRILEVLGINDPLFNKLYGFFDDGTAKMVKVIPGTGSIFLYYTEGAMNTIAYWVSMALKINKPSVGLVYISVILGALSILMMLLSIFMIPPILSGSLKVISGGKRWPRFEIMEKAIRMTFIWTISMIVLSFVFASLILLIYTVLFRLSTLYVETPIYPVMLIAWSLSIMILSAIYISNFQRIPIKETFRRAFLEFIRDQKNYALAGITLAIYYPLLIIWAKFFVLDILKPNIYLLLFYIITFPIHIWATVLYEILFRRIIQESFGGATPRAAIITATLSVSMRMIIPFSLAIIWFVVGGFMLFTVILLVFLFIIELVIELIAATFYFTTREVLPGALFNILFWYPLAYFVTERLILVLPI